MALKGSIGTSLRFEKRPSFYATTHGFEDVNDSAGRWLAQKMATEARKAAETASMSMSERKKLMAKERTKERMKAQYRRNHVRNSRFVKGFSLEEIKNKLNSLWEKERLTAKEKQLVRRLRQRRNDLNGAPHRITEGG